MQDKRRKLEQQFVETTSTACTSTLFNGVRIYVNGLTGACSYGQ
jgi:hypothetical protein